MHLKKFVDNVDKSKNRRIYRKHLVDNMLISCEFIVNKKIMLSKIIKMS